LRQGTYLPAVGYDPHQPAPIRFPKKKKWMADAFGSFVGGGQNGSEQEVENRHATRTILRQSNLVQRVQADSQGLQLLIAKLLRAPGDYPPASLDQRPAVLRVWRGHG